MRVPLEKKVTLSIDEIKEKIIPIAKKHGVAKMALFGSVAKGLYNEESDIDIIIDRGNIKLMEFLSFADKLEEALGKRVDLITYDSIEDYVYKESILNGEVVLYG